MPSSTKTLSRLVALTVFTFGAAHADASTRTLGPAAMDSYAQTVLVTFTSEGAARRAQLRMAGLYHDYRAAFSTRMDDCNLNDLRVAEVMAEHGQKGTFLLNDPAHWWQDSTETGVSVSGDLSVEVPRRLLAGGNSLGGHTLSHEMLPALSKNAAFREILGARVALETKSTSPNVVFVYPFVFYRSKLRDGVDRADLEEMLRRSGYYHLSEHRYNEGWDSGFQDGVFVICDGASYGGSNGESIVAEARGADERPLFLATMHAWVKSWGGPAFPKLAEVYRQWSGRSDWWYCNQNQYAAYRYQARHSRLATFVEGKVVRAVLTRPDPLDLGDWTPLTFRVDGVTSDEVVSVESRHAEAQPVALGGSYAFDLFHDRLRGPIEAYAEAANPANRDQFDELAGGTEGLRALLYRKGSVLMLALRNDGREALEDVGVVFRLPLRWETGVVRRRVGTLAGGASTRLEVPLTERTDAAHYIDGVEYDVAQIDFRRSHRVRLYASCAMPESEPPAFFVRNGFRVLGPLAGDRSDFDPAAFGKRLLEGAAPAAAYDMPWGSRLAWKSVNPSRASILDPDIIPTTGKPNIPAFYQGEPDLYFPHANVHYVLLGRMVSPDERTVHAVFNRECVKGLSLNGRKVEGADLALRKGVNDLRILYLPSTATSSTFDENNYGCYFRLTDEAGSQVEDVRFEQPPLP